MYDDDIKALFERVSKHFKNADEGARGMFGMLVKTALSYRDTLMHSSGTPLTVAETREALNVFMEVLKSQKIPDGLNKRIYNLVVLWLEALKETVHN